MSVRKTRQPQELTPAPGLGASKQGNRWHKVPWPTASTPRRIQHCPRRSGPRRTSSPRLGEYRHSAATYSLSQSRPRPRSPGCLIVATAQVVTGGGWGVPRPAGRLRSGDHEHAAAPATKASRGLGQRPGTGHRADRPQHRQSCCRPARRPGTDRAADVLLATEPSARSGCPSTVSVMRGTPTTTPVVPRILRRPAGPPTRRRPLGRPDVSRPVGCRLRHESAASVTPSCAGEHHRAGASSHQIRSASVARTRTTSRWRRRGLGWCSPRCTA